MLDSHRIYTIFCHVSSRFSEGKEEEKIDDSAFIQIGTKWEEL